MKFYLGTHEVSWLERTEVPLFVSRRRLERQRKRPRAIGSWALDSGGFTELDLHGGWNLSARSYALLVMEYAEEIGNLEWAAPQDWMCEPFIVAKTGLSVHEHQKRTVDNFLELRVIAPRVPFAPVLQGWRPDDYAWCVEMYRCAGVDLAKERVVGVGSVCRRQGTNAAVDVFEAIADACPGIKLHGFGIKTKGIPKIGAFLSSSDSMAWSQHARRRAPLKGCDHSSCANCLRYALRWRERMFETLEGVHGLRSVRRGTDAVLRTREGRGARQLRA